MLLVQDEENFITGNEKRMHSFHAHGLQQLHDVREADEVPSSYYNDRCSKIHSCFKRLTFCLQHHCFSAQVLVDNTSFQASGKIHFV